MTVNITHIAKAERLVLDSYYDVCQKLEELRVSEGLSFVEILYALGNNSDVAEYYRTFFASTVKKESR